MRILQLLIVGLAAIQLGASAHAQHRIDSSPQIERALRDRNRELLHPESDPIELRALDQSADGFRKGTPALQRADTSVALVDSAELRNRRLAMYATGARYDKPVPIAASPSTSQQQEEDLRPLNRIDEPQDDGSDEDRKRLIVLAGCGLLGCGLAVFVLRRR